MSDQLIDELDQKRLTRGRYFGASIEVPGGGELALEPRSRRSGETRGSRRSGSGRPSYRFRTRKTSVAPTWPRL
jgi:hypothetical protein